jgi:hypothetical protein
MTMAIAVLLAGLLSLLTVWRITIRPRRGGFKSKMGVESLAATYERFWRSLGGDLEEHIVEAERRLGIRLPASLRAFYRQTSLRRSEQLHLLTLAELRLEEDRLVFAMEQQGCWYWAVRLGDIEDEDPPVWTWGLRSTWFLPKSLESLLGRGDGPEGCSVTEWLRVFLLLNRASTTPMIHEFGFPEQVTPRLREAGWGEQSFDGKSLGTQLWTWRSVVYDGQNLGAPDRTALVEAVEALGEKPEDQEFH